MSQVVSRLIQDTPLPLMARVRQTFPRPRYQRQEIPALVRRELLRAGLALRVQAGQRVCLTAGSRGVDNYLPVMRATVDLCRELGAEPFIVPAMGSHGSATADGQREVLAGYGLTEESCGCPIISDMGVTEIGRTPDGWPVEIDCHAAAADAIIVVNRIKAHTCFRGPYESGLIKMLVIGLGKQRGAERLHSLGFGRMAELLPVFGRVVLEQAPVVMGLALVENGCDETCLIEAVPPGLILEREPQLLRQAMDNLARIYLDSCDVLMVERIGKNISGDGMDPNVTGAFATPYASGGLEAHRIALLDLTPESHGNPIGVAESHVITRRLFEKADFDALYMNCITAGTLQSARIPLVVDNDRQALQVCLKTSPFRPEGPWVIRIRDTLHLAEIMVSAALLPQVAAHPRLEQVSELAPPDFDPAGNYNDRICL